MSSRHKALLSRYDDVFLLDGVRTPFVEYNTANKLHVKMAHVDGTACSFSDCGESLGQKVGEVFAVCEPLFEFSGLAL